MQIVKNRQGVDDVTQGGCFDDQDAHGLLESIRKNKL
jgi:hypothetical protein